MAEPTTRPAEATPLRQKSNTPEPSAVPPGRDAAEATAADAPTKQGGNEDKTKPVIAYVGARLRDQLKRVCQKTHRSYTDVLFDAVDELDAELPQIFAEHLAGQPQQSLFTRRRSPVKAAAANKGDGPIVQVPLRLLPADLAILDERAERFAAGNRSEFIRIVWRTYLSRARS